MDKPYLRIVVEHDDGSTSVFHVTRIMINEPFLLKSEVGGVIDIEPVQKED